MLLALSRCIDCVIAVQKSPRLRRLAAKAPRSSRAARALRRSNALHTGQKPNCIGMP
jgi:hypothetical protein